MVNGRIAVYGTPSYLMHTYGRGYVIVITVKENNLDQAKLKMNELLPEAEFEVEERIPDKPLHVLLRYKDNGIGQERAKLSVMFKAVSELERTQVILTFLITRSTLSQVFKSFARFQHQPDPPATHLA
jgi:hypothetical protein